MPTHIFLYFVPLYLSVHADFRIFVYDMRAFLCVDARVGVCERGVPSHLFASFLLFFFLPRTTLMLHRLSLA